MLEVKETHSPITAVLVAIGALAHDEPEKKAVEMENVPETGVAVGDEEVLALTDEVELEVRLFVADALAVRLTVVVALDEGLVDEVRLDERLAVVVAVLDEDLV